MGRRHSSRDDHFSGDHLHRRAVELDESSRRSRREVRDPPRSGQNRSITPDERKVALSPTEARRPARSVVGEGRQILVSERGTPRTSLVSISS